jgi:hypothetical protein
VYGVASPLAHTDPTGMCPPQWCVDEGYHGPGHRKKHVDQTMPETGGGSSTSGYEPVRPTSGPVLAFDPKIASPQVIPWMTPQDAKTTDPGCGFLWKRCIASGLTKAWDATFDNVIRPVGRWIRDNRELLVRVGILALASACVATGAWCLSGAIFSLVGTSANAFYDHGLSKQAAAEAGIGLAQAVAFMVPGLAASQVVKEAYWVQVVVRLHAEAPGAICAAHPDCK